MLLHFSTPCQECGEQVCSSTLYQGSRACARRGFDGSLALDAMFRCCRARRLQASLLPQCWHELTPPGTLFLNFTHLLRFSCLLFYSYVGRNDASVSFSCSCTLRSIYGRTVNFDAYGCKIKIYVPKHRVPVHRRTATAQNNPGGKPSRGFAACLFAWHFELFQNELTSGVFRKIS